MSIILVSIDGFGIGNMLDTKITANTWKTLIKNSKISDFQFLKKISKEWIKVALDYEGADSYLGHLTMSGVKIQKISLKPLLFYLTKITKLLKKYNYQYQIFQGMINVENKFLIYDNFEGEYGFAINIAGIEEKINFNDQIFISKKIREIIKNPRLISFTAQKIKIKDYLLHTVNNHPFYGINTAKTGVYNDTFKVVHLPFIINFKNTIQYQFVKKGWKVYLYGKFANIIEIKSKKNVISNNDIDPKKIFVNLRTNLQKRTLHCVNIQQTDLAGHIGDVQKYIDVLNEIDSELASLSKKNIILIITSDHGNDPSIKNGKHTREYVPFWTNQKQQKIKFLSQIAEYIKQFL